MPASTKSRTAANSKRAAGSTPKRRPPAKGRGQAATRKGANGGGRGVNTRARRSLLAPRRPALGRGAPVLESQHVDIAALALIAVGIFISGVAYAGWSGGALGGGAVTVLRFLLGALGYVVPAGLRPPGAPVPPPAPR